MDTRTGKIHLFENEEETKARGLTPLSPKEYQAMLGIPEEKRPLELAILRFTEERKRLKAPAGLEVRNAFRLGWLARDKQKD